MKPQGRVGRHPTMNRRKPRVTTTLLARRARALQRYLPAAIRGEGQGVHQARVATRRLREAVPVLTTGVKGAKTGKARNKIRRLTRALGTVRELDVTLHILDELARRPGIPRNALEDVRAHVVLERDRRRTLMLERLADVNSEKLGRRLRAIGTALSQSDLETWRETLATRLLKRARRFDAAVKDAGHIYAPDRLHRVRIAAKKLRYTLELAADSGTASAEPLVRLLKRVQDTLGRLHDLQVLQQHVAEVQAAPPVRRGATDGGLEALHRTLEEECRHLHARYIASYPGLNELSETCRTLVAPQLTRHVARRQPPLKMTLRAGRPRVSASRA
jgi:CHAD domain-containing protein